MSFMQSGLVGAGKVDLSSKNLYDREAISKAVRVALLSAGLGEDCPEAPLASLVPQGCHVLLKPNWVLHANLGGGPMNCTVTQPEVIEAALDEVLLARPATVTLGDSPLQFCEFHSLVPEKWRASLMEKSRSAGVELRVQDFRRAIAKGALRPGLSGNGIEQGVEFGVRDSGHYVLFDLAKDSLLEPLSTQSQPFRITHYDHRELNRRHCSGRHQYLMCREAFEADVVISLPKLKTHHKAGMTGALKNLVGLNGDKDYLPHHRVGSVAEGGDCYPNKSVSKRVMEFCFDKAYQSINTKSYKYWNRMAQYIDQWHRRRGDAIREGAWHGNDTTWRMSLDLNRVIRFGKADGTLSDQPQRQLFSITDAVICGQGNGPLKPDPYFAGVISFSTSPAYADLFHSFVMGLDWQKLPIVREAFSQCRFPIEEGKPSELRVVFEGRSLGFGQLRDQFNDIARLGDGWGALFRNPIEQ